MVITQQSQMAIERQGSWANLSLDQGPLLFIEVKKLK